MSQIVIPPATKVSFEPPPPSPALPAYQILVVAGLAVALAASPAAVVAPRWFAVAFFALLTAIAVRLNIKLRHGYLGLESVTLMPAIIVLGSPALGAGIAAAAFLASPLLSATWKRVNLLRLFDAAQLGLSYFAAGLVWQRLAPQEFSLGYILLPYFAALAVQLTANTLLIGVYFCLDRRAGLAASLRELVAHQLLSFSAITPIALIMLLLERDNGLAGAALAFVPVVLAAWALRFITDTRRSAQDADKRGQELAVLRELSSVMADASFEPSLFDRSFELIQRLAPLRSGAVIFWEMIPSTPRAFVMGDCRVGPAEIVDWMHQEKLSESLSLASDITISGSNRQAGAIHLNPENTYQLRLALQTVEIIFGVILLEGSDPALQEEPTRRLLSVIADHFALTVQDKVLREQMQIKNTQLADQAETLQKILDISIELKSDLDLDVLLSNIARAVSKSLGFNTVLLSLFDKTKGLFERRAQAGLDHMWSEVSKIKVPKEEITQFFIPQYRLSKSYFVDHSHHTYSNYDVMAHERPADSHKGEWHPLDMLFIPLTEGTELIGYLSVDEPKDNKLPSVEEVIALEIFANQAVTAIQSARRYEQTKLQTIIDGLTEAHNHRFFQQMLIKEISRHERTGRPMALAMIDIDDFKSINDRYGHPAGDSILKELVRDMKLSVREMDLVARYGGEEFALIFPELEVDKAVQVAERIRNRIADRVYPIEDQPAGLHVTISVGLACFPDDALDKVSLIEKADQALYRAKRSGKNRVCLASAMDDLGYSVAVPETR